MPAIPGQSNAPIAALAIASYGSMLGSLFPVLTLFTSADISGGLSVAADSSALVNTVQHVGECDANGYALSYSRQFARSCRQ